MIRHAEVAGERHALETSSSAREKPSAYCCLGGGCRDPEICDNHFGKPCGWPGTREEWDRTSSSALTGSGNGERAVAQVKPTPGPWRIEPGAGFWVITRDGLRFPMTRKTRALAQEACDFENRMHAERLVRNAAPSMLAVLKQVEVWLAHMGNTDPVETNRCNARVLLAECSAAIALASGGKA